VKLSIIELKDQKDEDFFVNKYFDQEKIMNVLVENTKESGINELFVKDVE
jgi:hypothetical protein